MLQRDITREVAIAQVLCINTVVRPNIEVLSDLKSVEPVLAKKLKFKCWSSQESLGSWLL